MATRRVLSLLDAGAKVTLVSPEATEEIKHEAQKKTLFWINRSFREVDLGGALIVFLATSDKRLNERIAEMCQRRRIFCNVADDASLCDFVIPATVNRGDLTFTISTNGKVPFLAKYVRLEIEKMFGLEMAELLNLLAQKRREFLEEGQSVLVEKMTRLPIEPLREVLRNGTRRQAEEWLLEKMKEL